MGCETNKARWWITQHPEDRLDASFASREAAIAEGATYYCGEPFKICQGEHFKNRIPDFDQWIWEAFDETNEELAGEDYTTAQWAKEHCADLIRQLEAVTNKWLDDNDYRNAWSVDTGPMEDITPASAAALRLAQPKEVDRGK